MTIFAFVMLLITFIFLLERSYTVMRLRKIIASQELEIEAYKNKNEDFAMQMSRRNQGGTVTQDLLKDSVTSLLNKEALENQYAYLLSQSKRFNTLFALLILDIKDFKSINEKYSRAVGDKVLAEIAKRLKTTLRDIDIISRYEADIFVVLLPNMIKPEIVVHAIERTMRAINLPIEIDGNVIDHSVSAGVAVYPFDGADTKTLFINAKQALDKAKKLGKNVFQFYQEETQARGERELALKSAIKEPDFLENIILEYKPYYDISKNEINCIEVYALLNHPELGEISFSELTRVSQYSSRMLEFYEWVMRKAVEKFTTNNPLIFKFDLKQFESLQFTDQVIAMVNKTAKYKKQIILELLDYTDNDNLEVYRESIIKLNTSEIPVAIGILVLGHFALNKLNHLHFDYLKIDEQLVKGLIERSDSQMILQRILSLVDNLNVATLTTGVDTEEQKKLLENMGCSVMQGKLFKER